MALVAAVYNPSSAGCIPPCVPLRSWPKAAVAGVYAAAIGAFGAVIGAIIGSHHSDTLVYRRRPSAVGRAPARDAKELALERQARPG